MNRLTLLGAAARLARELGLGGMLSRTRDLIDVTCARRGRFPLSCRIDERDLRGLLRHRSFLEEVSAGAYECFSRDLFTDALTPGAIVIDGGSHIGLYSQLAVADEPELKAVLAFEPDPFNYAALRANLARYHDRVRMHRKALADHVGTGVFNVSQGTISSSLFHRPSVESTWSKHPVALTTIDNEVAEEVDGVAVVMKLDLEGAEPLAAQGMRRTLERASAAAALVEVNTSALKAGGFTPAELVARLRDIGLRVWYVDERRGQLRSVNVSAPLKGNLYCEKA
jgi:FkbM family methyltransferase